MATAAATIDPDRYGLADHALAEQLATRGYVVVDALDPGELEDARARLDALGSAPGDGRTGFHSDAWTSDEAFRRAASATVADLLRGVLAAVAPHHAVLAAARLVKWPGPGGGVPSHRDPSFVDEGRWRSITIWCATEDLDVASGGLWVVPGSHRLAPEVRAHDSPENLFPEVDADLEAAATFVPLAAGQAIVFDHALVHGSRPSAGTGARTVLAAVAVPADAQVVYPVADAAGVVHLLAAGPELFLADRVSQLDVDAAIASWPSLGELAPAEPTARPTLAELVDLARSGAAPTG